MPAVVAAGGRRAYRCAIYSGPTRGNGVGTETETGLAGVLGDLTAEEERLAAVLGALTAAEWRSESAASGWAIADVVLHLAQSEELAVASLTGATATSGWSAGEGTDSAAERMVQAQRAAPAEVFERWQQARRASLEALGRADPRVAVPWVATPLRPRTLATTRLAEHWAHGLDVTAPLGIAWEDSDRLRHVAWLAHRTIPYAFAVAEEPAPVVRCELAGPSGAIWAFGPEDAPNRVSGTVGDFCRVGARRVAPSETGLVADGPAAARVLELLRNYAA